MAGYPISELKKASESKGRDLFPIQQDGVTRQVELGILSNASKITASTSSGVITKEGSYVLQNNSAVINFTLNNAVGRTVSNNDYVDSASAAAGWIVKVINLSTRSHTVIAGSNSWTIAAGDVHEYYWTGSAWTFHNVVTESRLNNALTNYDKAELWTDSLVNIANDTTLKAGKEITFTVNDTTISDLPVANRGIVITRKNSLNNRCIQEYHCNESTNNSIYYRYLEWNGTRWGVGVVWKKLTTESDLANYPRFLSNTIVDVPYVPNPNNPNYMTYTVPKDMYLTIGKGTWINFGERTILYLPEQAEMRGGLYLKKGQTIAILRAGENITPSLRYWELL